jgi:hypothetical protein
MVAVQAHLTGGCSPLAGSNDTSKRLTLEAIDIAKHYHDVLFDPATPGRRRRLRLANNRQDFESLAVYLRGLNGSRSSRSNQSA